MEFLEMLKQKFNIHLNEQQKSAVMHKDGPAIILAVPGAGKTTTLICRTANLILNHGISPINILSITFSKASANDMKHRFTKMFGGVINESIHFSTIHSFAFTVLRHYCNINNSKMPSLIEGEDSPMSKVSLLKNIYLEVNKEYISDDGLEELSNVIGFVKNMMMDVDSIEDEFDIDNLKEIYTKYENLKKQNKYMDYDDLLVYAFRILKQSKAVLDMMRGRYKYIQVDEGQDTSKIQHEIIKLISAPNINLFMVADDDQSIYGFRGAYPRFLLEFKDVYPSAKIYFMEENYRSTKSIVSTANEFIKRNTQRYSKNLFTNNEAGSQINILSFKNENDQYDHMIKDIRKHNKPSDVAVLFRSNISAIPVVDILDRNNISFYVREKKLHFFKHWITQDIISFIQLAFDENDINSFEKIYYKMNLYISKEVLNLVKISKDAYKKSVFDIMTSLNQLTQKQKENVIRVRGFIRQIPKKDPLKAIEIIEKYINYKDYVQNNSTKNGCSVETSNNILSSLKTIASNSNSVSGFIGRLEDLQLIIENATNNRGKDVVTLTTVHSSKGLEFEEVYLIDLIDEQFPTYYSIDLFERGEIEQLEEERRLFYVGLTRGRKQVNLISLGSKNGDRVKVSRFVQEVDFIINGEKAKTLNSKLRNAGTILHKNFGRGRIVNLEEDTMTVVFDGNVRKTLSVDVCVRSGLISMVDDSTGDVVGI